MRRAGSGRRSARRPGRNARASLWLWRSSAARSPGRGAARGRRGRGAAAPLPRAQAASPGTSHSPADDASLSSSAAVASAAPASAASFAFEIPGVQMLSPRGRHAVRVSRTGCTCTARVPRSSRFPSPAKFAYSPPKVDNYGKISADLWVLVLKDPVASGKQMTSTIVFQTKPKPKPIDPNPRASLRSHRPRCESR